MNDNIELHSYNSIGRNDSEEYHEINESAVYTDKIEEKGPESPTTQIKFFTQSKHGTLSKQKKKTKKRTQQSRNVMEIINTKIASESLPITENVIHIESESDKPSYLQKKCRLDKILKVKPHTFDVEHAVHRRIVKLNVNFPTDEKLNSRENYIHTNYVEPRFFEDIDAGTETGLKEINKFLDISVHGLHFNHHHTFSLEKILAIKLEQYYNEYVDNEKQIINLLRAIDVNRQTRENLKEKFTTVSPKKENDIRFDATILKYTDAFLKSKENYNDKIKKRRNLVNIILLLWSDIKNVRRKSGFTNTPFILEVEKNTNEEVFAEKWSELFHNEYTDMLIELEYSYVNRYLEYKKFKTDEKYVKNKILKPKLQIEPDRIKKDVVKRVEFVLNPEDVLVSLKFDKRIVKVTSKTEIEKYAGETVVYLKIYVDDMFVCESEHVKVEDFFLINYHDSITLQILMKNKTLTLVMCEENEDMSAITMDLDAIRKKSINVTDQDFVYYDKIIDPTSSRVGNGYTIDDIAAVTQVRLKSSNLFKGKLYTSCKIKLNIAWNESLSGNQSSPVKHCINIEKRIHRILHGVDTPNINTLLEILNVVYDIEIDDEEIIQSLKELCEKTIKDKNHFTDDLQAIRFKLLKLRSYEKFSNINKAIPLSQSQITTEQLSSLQNSEKKGFDVEYFESKRGDMDPIDLQRYMGVKFMEKLNKKILNELNEVLMRRTHKDVVKDYQYLSLRNIFTKKLISLGSSSVTKKQSIEDGLAKEQEIYITVLRAFNLFDRSDSDERNYENIAGYKVRPLRPFVRLSYNSETVQTSTAVGNNPTWSYTAKIKTKLEPLSSIHINVYDEHNVNVGQESEQSFRYRCHNQWLGTLAIPISTVLNLGSIRGTFKIATPPIILGYENAPKDTTSVIPEIIRLMKKETAFITLRITTSLSNLGVLQSYYQPCDNDNHILRHLNNFVTEYLNEFPSRNLSLTFIDSSGKNKCVTELIQPIPLPDIKLNDANIRSASSSKSSSLKGKMKANVFELADISRLVNVAVRYVSLIPTYEVIQSHVVTLMGIELLKVLYGSPMDHTLLLAGYFLELGIKCYVAIGYGLPRGLSSYVLVKYDGNRIIMGSDIKIKGFLIIETCSVYIFDAVNGERHDVREAGCPLKTVSYVFDNENIWVNRQSYQDCENLSFDFTKSSNWQMVFDRTVFVLKQPPITIDVYYPPGDVTDLKNNLEAKIKTKIQKWRWNIKTVWNRYLGNILLESLARWEHWSLHANVEKPAPGHQLTQLMESYKVFGFPINIQYLNTKSVVSRVKSTMLHVNDDPNAEFGLAVEVYAYPNNVLSVWVFLACITRE